MTTAISHPSACAAFTSPAIYAAAWTSSPDPPLPLNVSPESLSSTRFHRRSLCAINPINYFSNDFLRSAFFMRGLLPRCLKNSTWRRRFFASASVRYVPNDRPVLSDTTTYFPFTFLIICRGWGTIPRPQRYECCALPLSYPGGISQSYDHRHNSVFPACGQENSFIHRSLAFLLPNNYTSFT